MKDKPALLIEKLRTTFDHFDGRKSRAQARAKELTRRGWSFALLGLNVADQSYLDFGEIAIRFVEESPGEIELAGALIDKKMISQVGRYSAGIQYELFVALDSVIKQEDVFNVAWWLVALLRIKTTANVLVPCAADCSWSVIAGSDADSVSVRFIEDVPRARIFGKKVVVDHGQVEWAIHSMADFAHLLNFPKFRLAVDAFTTYAQETSLRMSAASLWAGVEALFGVDRELTFTVAAYTASLLEAHGTSRLELFLQMKKLYSTRSKAVHGMPVDDESLIVHIESVRDILSRLLLVCISRKSVPDAKELQTMLFVPAIE